MKSAFAMFFMILAGCSSAPVVDYKTAPDAKEIISDEVECHYLADKAFKTSWTLSKSKVYYDCLEGRGYSIINR